MQENYVLLSDYSKEHLQISVNSMITKGYFPLGNVSVTFGKIDSDDDSTGKGEDYLFTQAMVLAHLK